MRIPLKSLAGVTLVGAIAAVVFAPAAQTATTLPNCKVATNIATILDDSGSMAGTDPTNQRVAGIKLLINKSNNQKKTMSALQFGTDASPVFPPLLIGTNKPLMEGALDTLIKADDGSTNYNAAFDLRKSQNPGANRIIFLTDGGHNAGFYANPHVGGPPVDVVGFGTSTAGEDGTRLQQIATDTGGTYHPQTDATNLKATMNEIDATENCEAAPQRFSDVFTVLNQVIKHDVTLPGSTKSLDIVLTWADPTNEFDATKFSIVQGGRTVASTAKKRKKKTKLKITRTKGAGFETIHIRRVKRGKLKFRLKANKLVIPGATLVTQVSQGTSSQ